VCITVMFSNTHYNCALQKCLTSHILVTVLYSQKRSERMIIVRIRILTLHKLCLLSTEYFVCRNMLFEVVHEDKSEMTWISVRFGTDSDSKRFEKEFLLEIRIRILSQTSRSWSGSKSNQKNSSPEPQQCSIVKFGGNVKKVFIVNFFHRSSSKK
jgi:hypothetical protein